MAPSRPVKPMDTEGLDPRLSTILQRYYQRSLGGAENWDSVESMRLKGVLEMENGNKASFVGYMKKPDFCKVRILLAGGKEMVMSYDGEDAWQQSPQDPVPVDMPETEAVNFIRDAAFGGHLLYPLLPGKQIDLLGMRRVEGDLCYDLQVTLPGGQRVRYAVDSTDFQERMLIVTNAVNGALEETRHSDIRRVDGVQVPFCSRMEIDGQFVQEIRLREVEANIGLTPWFFSRGELSEEPVTIDAAPEGASLVPSLDWTPSVEGGFVSPFGTSK